MVEWHHKSKRKPSGGLLKSVKRSDKKLSSRGGVFVATTIASGEKDIKVENMRHLGGKEHQRVKKALYANVADGKKIVKARILSVLENSANRLYTRRNILTKGAFIAIQIGSDEKTAKITSRPGQSGTINAMIAQAPVKQKKEKSGAGREKNPMAKGKTVQPEKTHPAPPKAVEIAEKSI